MAAREDLVQSHKEESTSKRRVRPKLNARHRIAGVLAVLTIVMLGSVPWLVSGRDASAFAARQDVPESAAAGTFEFEYFPGRYVNQAKEVEAHIQAY